MIILEEAIFELDILLDEYMGNVEYTKNKFGRYSLEHTNAIRMSYRDYFDSQWNVIADILQNILKNPDCDLDYVKGKINQYKNLYNKRRDVMNTYASEGEEWKSK